MASTMIVVIAASVALFVALVVALTVRCSTRLKQQVGAMAGKVGGEGVKSTVNGTAFSGHTPEGAYGCIYSPGSDKHPSSLTIRLERPAPGELVVTREKGFDRLAKNIGLAEEMQAGSETFDHDFYLDTEHVPFFQAFLRDGERRDAVSALFGAGYPLSRLSFGPKGIQAFITPMPSKKLEGFPLDLFLEKLTVLARGLPTPEAVQAHASGFGWSEEEMNSTSGKRGFAFLLSIPILLFILGFVSLVIGLISYRPQGASLVWRSLQYSLPAWLLFSWIAYGAVKGRSSSHKRFLLLFLLGLPSFLVGTLGILLFLNGKLDREPGRTYTMLVWEKYVTRNKNDRDYHIRVPHWNPAQGTTSFEVKRSFYDRIIPGRSNVDITIRPGRFHQEWLESIELREPFVLPEAGK